MKSYFQSFVALITKHSVLVQLFFIIFYSIGIAGLLIPATFPIFIKLVPLTLLLSFSALLLLHESKITKNTVIAFVVIFLFGFGIEAIGVNTKLIFGDYWYGNSLGVKIYQTPIIIGLNWLLLVYVTASCCEKLQINNFLKIIIASSLMLFYDIIIEQVASKMDMWYWNNNAIPLQNYFAWFGIAFLMHFIVKWFGISLKNKLATTIYIVQLLFFVVLLLFLS